MSALLDRFDAAEIFVLASVDAISVEEARNQLQSHIAVDVMIEGLDQRFIDSITSESCATPPVVENSAAPPSELEVQTRALTTRLLPELLPLPESARTPAPLPPSSSSRTPSPDSASNPGPFASAMTTDAPIDLETEAGDRSDFEFRVVMTAVTEMDVRRAVDAICDYLNWDDRVDAATESLHFPEFEHLEPTIRP